MYLFFILTLFNNILELKLPHQWNATLPCREEDGWRKCNLNHDTYKDEFITKCTSEWSSIGWSKFETMWSMSDCINSYIRALVDLSPHYYNMTKELQKAWDSWRSVQSFQSFQNLGVSVGITATFLIFHLVISTWLRSV